MTDSSDNPFKFWQELKRRKVFRVIIGYLASAYVILELTSIIAEPFGLPQGSIKLVFILLSAGLVIAIYLSWVYDFTPKGIKKTESAKAAKGKPQTEPVKRKFTISNVINAVLIVIVLILAYPRVFKKDKFEEIKDPDGRISIAVMPFENQTGDTTLNWFQRGMSSLIINGLGSSTELTVRDEQSMYEVLESFDQVLTAGLSPSRSVEVAEKAHAETFITGSFQGREGNYFILANLVNTESGDIIWTHKVEGDLKSSGYLDLANSLCDEIKNYLEIKALEQDADYDFHEAFPESSEAYRYYIQGINLILDNEREPAVKSLEKAFEIDSTFTFAAFFIAYAYNMIWPPQSEPTQIWIKKAYETRDNLPLKYQYWLETWYAVSVSKSRPDLVRYCNLLEESGINTRIFWFDLATTYHDFLRQYEKSIMAYEKVEELNREGNGYWDYARFYQMYGDALHDAGKYQNEKEIHDLSLSLFGDNINKREIYWRQAIWAFSQKDTIQGNEYLDNYISMKKEMGETENIEYWVGQAYRRSNMPIEAAAHFRNAIKQNPHNVNYVLNLARMLIYESIDLNEGRELIQGLNDSFPDNKTILTILGWGCYQTGRYNEALQYLRRVEELGVTFTAEDDLNQQIQAVEQALANQNSKQ